MNTIGVNISANKTFTDAAEELLTRHAHTVHELCTELLTSSAVYQGKAKNAQLRTEIRLTCDTYIRCLIAGWSAAVKGSATPPRSSEPRLGKPRIDNLTDPFCSRGFHIAMGQIDALLRKGEHRSQQRVLGATQLHSPDGTQLPQPTAPPRPPAA